MPIPAALMGLLLAAMGGGNALLGKTQEQREIDKEERLAQYKEEADRRKDELTFARTILSKNPAEVAPEQVNMAADIMGKHFGSVPESLANFWTKSNEAAQVDAQLNKAAMSATQGGPTQKVPEPSPSYQSPSIQPQSMYQPTHPETPRVKAAIGGNETAGQPDPYATPNLQGSKAFGKYQFMEDTWNRVAREAAPVLGRKPSSFDITNPNDQETLATFDIDNHLNAGHTPTQVARYWYTGDPNSTLTTGTMKGTGIPYNVPKYEQDFNTRYAQLGGQIVQPTPQPQPYLQQPEQAPTGLPYGVSLTKQIGHPPSFHIDGSKTSIGPTEQENFSRWLNSMPKGYQDAYNLGQADIKSYGLDPVIHHITLDKRTNQYVDTRIRKFDGALLGSKYVTNSMDYTPEELSTQAAQASAARTTADLQATEQFKNAPAQVGMPGAAPMAGTPAEAQPYTPPASLPPQTTIADVQSSREAKAAADKETATATAKMEVQLVPAQNLLERLKALAPLVQKNDQWMLKTIDGLRNTFEATAKSGAAYDWNNTAKLLGGAITKDLDGRFNIDAWKQYTSTIGSFFAGKTSTDNAIKNLEAILSTARKMPQAEASQFKEGFVYHIPDPRNPKQTIPAVLKDAKGWKWEILE